MLLRVAHSPDADDAFMMRGFVTGAVGIPGVELELVADDIEALNRSASDQEAALDVSAISFAAWPHAADEWDLLPVGSSFGLGWGPRIVSRRPLTLGELADAEVAIPGERTTAALLLRLLAPGVRTRVVPFLRVADVVAAGECDAGVVIHEAQLTYEAAGLQRVVELGEWWAERTDGLPLPLGANAIRASLPPEVKRAFAGGMRRSIEHALTDRERSVAASVSPDRGLDAEQGDRYVAMYVNELTLDPGDAGRRAVDELYARGARAGLVPEVRARWAG